MPEIRTLALVVITSLVLVILGVGSISSQAQASTKKYIGDEFGINSIRLAPTQHVSANSSAVIDFKTLLNVPIELYQPISIAVNSVALENLPDNNLTVSSVNYSQNWLYAILVTNHAVDNHWEEVRDKDLVEVLANRREDGGWISFVKGTQGFLQLAQAAPSSWMDFSYLTKDASSRPSTVNLTQSVEYLFPWIAGQNWFQVQGWHQGDHLDFQPVVRTNPPTHFAVLAAAEGTMSLVCGGRGTLDPYQVHIRISHPDGNSTYYLHLDANTIRYDLIGKSITRGQFIGLLYNGVQGSGNGYQFNTNCGYGQAVHLHFGVPRNITINGYAVNTVASATFATKYGSSNMRIDDVDVPGWFTTDVHLSTGSGFTIARWAQQQGGYWDSQKWFTGDFDGDGKTDFANLYNDNEFASIDVHRSTGTSFELQHWAGQQGGYWDSQKWFMGDFDGDGKTDFANLYNDNEFASIDVHRSTGTSFELQHWAGQQGGYWDSQKWFMGDFDGDGKTDFANLYNDNEFASIDVHRSTGTSFELQHWAGQQGGYWDSQKWFTGDFNGDGKTDFANLYNDNGFASIDVHRSTGTSFELQHWAGQQGGYWDSQKWFTGDFSGDGKTDFANLYNDNGFASIDVHRSTGTSFELQHWAGQQGGYWDSQKWFTGDFNGDGKTDFANLYNDNGFASIDVHRSTGTSFELQHWAGQQGGYWDSQKWFTGDFNGDKKVELTKIWKDIGPVVNSVASTGAVLATPYSLAEIPSDTFTSAVTLTQAIHFEIPSTLAAYSRNLTTLPNNLIGLNRFYESSAVYSNSLQLAIPTQPYSLTIQYDEPDIMGVNEYTIALYYWNGNQWVKEPSSTLDTVNNRVNATPKVLGQWAILGSNSWPIYLPTIVK